MGGRGFRKSMWIQAGCWWPVILVGIAQAEVGSYQVENYYQYVGRPHFFGGRLLTAEDLTDEQNYQRQKDRHLPGFDGLTLLEMFTPAGRVDVTLFFETQDVGAGEEPTDLMNPQLDDFILLDDATGRWRGQIYLQDPPGVHELEGTFAVPEPGVLTVLALGLAGLGVVRRRPSC